MSREEPSGRGKGQASELWLWQDKLVFEETGGAGMAGKEGDPWARVAISVQLGWEPKPSRFLT